MERIQPKWSDAELTRRIIEGDADAFAELDRGYGALIAYVARAEFHLTQAEAEDLHQDLLVSLMNDNFRHLRSYRGESPFAAWLAGIVRHRCLDHKRKAVRQCRVRSAQPVPASCARFDPDTHLAVRQTLDRVSPDDSLFLSLYFLRGHSYSDIARMLNMPINTVASRLLRARASFKKMWAPMQESAPPARQLE